MQLLLSENKVWKIILKVDVKRIKEANLNAEKCCCKQPIRAVRFLTYTNLTTLYSIM